MYTLDHLKTKTMYITYKHSVRTSKKNTVFPLQKLTGECCIRI